MHISSVHTLAVPRAKLFDALINPDLIQQCIDGCDKLQPAGPDAYKARMAFTVAGFRATVDGSIVISDKHPLESVTMTIEGRSAPGFVKATSRLRLQDKGTQTEVQCDADAEVGGLIASMGPALIEVTVKKMLDDFFRKMGALVTE